MVLAPPEHARVWFNFMYLYAGVWSIGKGFVAVGVLGVCNSEGNKFANQTDAANFRDNHPPHGDITTIDTDEIPEHDVLLAGFPCQPFSIAGVYKKNSLGRKHGFLDETQGTLFFDVARILKARRPAAFLLENRSEEHTSELQSLMRHS